MLQGDNDLQVTDIKAFVASKDYAISKAFYTDIGFDSEYVSDDLTLFWNGECQLFLQRFYSQELAKNFMLQICVTDIQTAYQKCLISPHKTKIAPIQNVPWGEVFFVWGPAGELLHVTQLNDTK